MLSFALVYAGSYDGRTFQRPTRYDQTFYAEMKPISEQYEFEALGVNKLDRERLLIEGKEPTEAMSDAAEWVQSLAGKLRPVLVAFPLSFDWSWLYWYFTRFSRIGSPFNHSSCYDIKTAYAVKGHRPVALSGRNNLLDELKPAASHTHHALDDAVEQAEIFGRIFEWGGTNGRRSESSQSD